MISAAKAYLKTEGTLSYRDCEVAYYTYSMFDDPNKYRVNVNVGLHYTQNNFIKTLSLDDTFDREDAAIKFAVEQGKNFIDNCYDLGKISIIKPDLLTKAKNDKAAKAEKTDKYDKPKDPKNKTDKK